MASRGDIKAEAPGPAEDVGRPQGRVLWIQQASRELALGWRPERCGAVLFQGWRLAQVVPSSWPVKRTHAQKGSGQGRPQRAPQPA